MLQNLFNCCFISPFMKKLHKTFPQVMTRTEVDGQGSGGRDEILTTKTSGDMRNACRLFWSVMWLRSQKS